MRTIDIFFFNLKSYLPILVPFSFLVIGLKLLKVEKSSEPDLDLKHFAATIYSTILICFIGTFLYQLSILIYAYNFIHSKDMTVQISFLTSPLIVLIPSYIKYGLMFFVSFTLIKKYTPFFLKVIFSPGQTSVSYSLLWTSLSIVGIIISAFLCHILGNFFGIVKYRDQWWSIFQTGLTIQRQNMSITNTILFLIPTVAMIAFVEEFLFRGIIFGWLKNRINIKLAVIISAILFASYHGSTFLTVITLFQFLAGFIMSVVYIKTKSIYPLIIAHGVYLAIPYLFKAIRGS